MRFFVSHRLLSALLLAVSALTVAWAWPQLVPLNPGSVMQQQAQFDPLNPFAPPQGGPRGGGGGGGRGNRGAGGNGQGRGAARGPGQGLGGIGFGGQGMFGGNGIPARDYNITGPQWTLDPAFKQDAFTFARLHYISGNGRRSWDDDTSDADVNITFRLKEVTSMLTRPGLTFIDIKLENLSKYPFVYLAVTSRGVDFTGDELDALRAYLLNGGFMMAEDFWGDDGWDNFYAEFKRLFPNREPVQINLEDPIFHTIFNFNYLPQMPSVSSWTGGRIPYDPAHVYSRYGHGPRYFAAYDDNHRMMMLICHNNHYGDGWEHEGDDHSYFDVFSEPQAYPMMINILYYTMTH